MTVTVRAEPLIAYAEALLAGAGFTREHARVCAEALAWAEARGHAGHGVALVARYIWMAGRGILDPRATIDVRVIKGGVAHVDAHRALGPAALVRAADVAIERARAAATAWVLVQDHGHGGAIGYYARRVADAGMLAIMMTASRPMMAYHGTRVPALATSPIAIAIPGGGLLDMSTAAIAMGKIDAARDAGRPLPAGVALDRDGGPTTDPAQAAMPLPIAGAKGSGLALMIEALTSVALANPLVASALRDPAQLTDYRLNSLMIALDLDVLGGVAQFTAGFESLAAAIKAQPRAAGFDRIHMPGERGDLAAAERRREGIALSDATWMRLGELAREYGVPIPAPAASTDSSISS